MLFQLKHIILSLIICCPFITSAQKEFKLNFCKEGVSVYSKNTSNKNHIEYKGAITIDSSCLKKAIQILTDYENHKNWVYNCKNSSLIKEDKNTTHLYQVCNATWPFKNRDYVLCLERKELENGNIKVDFKSVSNMVSNKKDLVRIDEFSGYWEIEKKASKVIITMYGNFNPKMKLPQAIMKKYSKKIPFNTLLNLKRQLTL